MNVIDFPGAADRLDRALAKLEADPAVREAVVDSVAVTTAIFNAAKFRVDVTLPEALQSLTLEQIREVERHAQQCAMKAIDAFSQEVMGKVALLAYHQARSS